MEKEKIKFKDLDIWLKVIIIWGYLMIGFYALSFLLGFFEGVKAI